jgi:hypothetical protein
MATIFLSYARGDDEPFVRRLHDDLTAAGFTVWFDRVSMPSRALTFLQEIRDAIAAADRLLLVVGPRAAASDYVAAEWRCALELCIAVTPVLRLGNYNLVSPELSVHHCPDARPERPYADALAELLRILAEAVPPLASLHGVPSLPAHFLPRPADLAFLDETVLADVRRPTVISSAKQTTALQGMGGVGKSVLAAAFARSCGARRAFGDGVVWLTLGQQPDLLRVALALAAALGDNLAEYTDLQRARNRLPKLLADKKCLLVLDDAWDVAHAEIFANSLGPRCRLLVTTRDGGLAAALGAQERRLDVLEPDAALSLLAAWAGQPSAKLPAEARAVAAECGNLPFALALCGAMARDGAPWADLLDALRKADLAFLHKQFPNYPYPDVLRALKVSVDALAASNPTWARHYQELAVFPADEAVPEAAIVQLWVHTNGLNERAARQLLTTLGRKLLVRLEGQAPHRHVALHSASSTAFSMTCLTFVAIVAPPESVFDAARHNQIIARRSQTVKNWRRGARHF